MVHTDTHFWYTDVHYQGFVLRFWGWGSHKRAVAYLIDEGLMR